MPGMTLERVKAEREAEAKKAAQVLGVHDIQFWDLGDYPITLTNDSLFRLVDVYRAIHPAFVLTHSKEDIYNRDHPAVTDFAQHARITAQAHGHNPHQKVLGAPPFFLFEPHQPEQCNFKPDVILNIDSVWEKKYAAFQVLAAQKHLWEYYQRVALNRGVQGGRNTGKPMTYGEAYMRLFPEALEVLA
jgi:4-oxalomesaconate hydratase